MKCWKFESCFKQVIFLTAPFWSVVLFDPRYCKIWTMWLTKKYRNKCIWLQLWSLKTYGVHVYKLPQKGATVWMLKMCLCRYWYCLVENWEVCVVVVLCVLSLFIYPFCTLNTYTIETINTFTELPHFICLLYILSYIIIPVTIIFYIFYPLHTVLFQFSSSLDASSYSRYLSSISLHLCPRFTELKNRNRNKHTL